LKFAPKTRGVGLRISEGIALKLTDIDSQRILLHVDEGRRHDLLGSPMLSGVWRVSTFALS
jgi:hypothetical protein